MINNKLLIRITCGMNLLIVNPRACEHLILTNGVMGRIDLKLSGHLVVGIILIVMLD